MNQELNERFREGQQAEAVGDSLERSERSERSGSEAPTAARAASGGSDTAPDEARQGPPTGALPDEIEAYLVEEVDPANWEPPPTPPNLKARPRGTLAKKPERPRMPLSPQQKLLLLDTWQRSGLPARDFGALVNISRHTLYAWKRSFELEGPAGLMEKARMSRRSQLSEITKRAILMLKQAHPEWGCQRISDMLARGPALAASATSVARVLREAGYEMVEEPTRRHPDRVRSFEREQPNELWQTDLFSFVLKRQNRRLYLVAFMDDHSRFITGFGLHASQSAALVLEVLRAALASYSPPREILTDNGAQYVTWRGKSQFTRELEKRGIKQIVARPRRPQTLGKIERFWGTLWRECLETAIFLDLADARQRIALFIDYYNFQRAHQGIDGLVPADRFFEAAPEVLQTMKQRVAANALELARRGVPKKPFYLTGQLDGKPFSVHREGDRVILRQAGQEREEIDLPPPPPGEADLAGESERLPTALCPDGSPTTAWNPPDALPLPGVSALDATLQAIRGEEDEARWRDEHELEPLSSEDDETRLCDEDELELLSHEDDDVPLHEADQLDPPAQGGDS